MSFAPGINGVALYEEATPETFTIDGHNVSTDSPEQTPITRQSGRGTLKKLASTFEWTLRHDDEALHNSLDAAAHNTMQWKLVVWTFNGVKYVLDKATFAPEEVPQFDPESEEFPYQIRYEVRGGTQIAQGVDLILAWRRSQGLGALTDGATNEVVTLPFPFEGATVTLSNEATSITVEALDASGVSLGSSTTSTGTGRVSAELTLPAGTQDIKVTLDAVQSPALRVDGSTQDPN